MIHRKGVLVNNALVLIIAVICLAVLFIGAYKLYVISIEEEERKAINILNILEAKINALEDGQSNTFAIFGLEGWSLVGWSKGEAGRPDKCFFDSCICICKGKPPGDLFFVDKKKFDSMYHFSDYDNYFLGDALSKKDLTDFCQKKGFCRFFDKDLNIITQAERKGLLRRDLREDIEDFPIWRDYISFNDNLLSGIFIGKKRDDAGYVEYSELIIKRMVEDEFDVRLTT